MRLLVAPPAAQPWKLPAWLAPDTQHWGVVLARLALTVGAAWLAQRLLFLLVRRGEQWLVHAARDTGHGAQRARPRARQLPSGRGRSRARGRSRPRLSGLAWIYS